MQPKINIVILNWNGYDDTVELLESLFKIIYNNFHITVVDNYSSGDDVKKMEAKYENKIQIIVSEDNLGYAGGNNLGIAASLKEDYDYILLLNNDTTVESDFLNILLEEFEKDEKVGITAPQINYYYNPEMIWSAGGKISRLKGSGFTLTNKLDSEVKIAVDSIEFVSGCCMLIKKEVFLSVGLLDDDFFLYLEDLDFCYRTLKAGFKIYICRNSKVYHKVNNATKNNVLTTTMPLYYTTRNRLYFAKKNYSKMFLLTLIYLFSTMLLKSIIWLFTGKFNNIIAVQHSFIDFFFCRMGKNTKLFNFKGDILK